MLNLQIPHKLINSQAIEICRILNKEGYQAFIVGGCVRDLLLGAIPKDYDICTDATPNKIIELFPKTIPTGLQHGTVTVVMGEGIQNHFEVTTFRIEGNYTDGRRPEEVFFVMHIEQDLARRDLTINSIAYDPITKRLVDPFNGIGDLQSGLLKAVGNADYRFKEDGLRIMRVARFAARFKYKVDENTLSAMSANLDTLNKISKERVKDELCKILMTDNQSYGIQLLEKCGALKIICPLLATDPYMLFIPELDKCKGDLETRLAFLYGNMKSSESYNELLSLKFSNKELKRISFLLELLDRYMQFSDKSTVSAYKGFMAIIKNHAPDPWEDTLNQFKILIGAIGYKYGKDLDKYKDEIVFSKREMQINGNDLLEAGIKSGPQIKTVLDTCYLEILRNPDNNNKEYLLKYCKTI